MVRIRDKWAASHPIVTRALSTGQIGPPDVYYRVIKHQVTALKAALD